MVHDGSKMALLERKSCHDGPRGAGPLVKLLICRKSCVCGPANEVISQILPRRRIARYCIPIAMSLLFAETAQSILKPHPPPVCWTSWAKRTHIVHCFLPCRISPLSCFSGPFCALAACDAPGPAPLSTEMFRRPFFQACFSCPLSRSISCTFQPLGPHLAFQPATHDDPANHHVLGDLDLPQFFYARCPRLAPSENALSHCSIEKTQSCFL